MRHPLEPLSSQESQLAVRLLRNAGKVTPTTRFVSVSLKEPPKDARPRRHGADLPREAFVVLFDNATNTAHEAVVALSRGTRRLVPLASPACSRP